MLKFFAKLTTMGIAATALLTLAQAPQPKLDLPFGSVVRLASPDASKTLFLVPYQSGVNNEAQLWVEDTRTHRRQMLMNIARTLSAAWNADGSAFYVQDNESSDDSFSYIYDANTLQRLNLAERILASDPGAGRLTEGHFYFDVDRWQGLGQVIVRLHGHTDKPPPIVCFDSRYRVTRAGAVAKLSQRVSPVNNRCG
jgi:hypothetical protein